MTHTTHWSDGTVTTEDRYPVPAPPHDRDAVLLHGDFVWSPQDGRWYSLRLDPAQARATVATVTPDAGWVWADGTPFV